jgi:hypothetical protein
MARPPSHRISRRNAARSPRPSDPPLLSELLSEVRRSQGIPPNSPRPVPNRARVNRSG